MQCCSCGTENPSGRKYCGKCGSSLATVCPSCGAPNDAQFDFCGECGSPLSGSASTAAVFKAASPPAPPPAGPLAGRRPFSILFSDPGGVPPLLEAPGPQGIPE